MKFETNPAYFLDSIYNGACILDDELNIVFWNKWLEAHTSMSREQVIGQKITELFPEINARQLKRKIVSMKVLKSHTYYDAGTDGYLIKIKSFKYTNSVFKYMKQNVVISPFDEKMEYAIVMIYDQTRLFETQKKLEESESFQRAVFDRSANGIIILTTDGNIVTVNEAFEKLTGLVAEKVIGSHLSVFVGDMSQVCKENFFALVDKSKDSFEIELTIQTPRSFWCKLSGSVIFNANGQPDFFICIIDDITERKAFVEELKNKSEYVQKILDFQSNIIIVTDGKQILNCNKSFMNFFQTKSLEDFNVAHPDLSKFFIKQEGLITGEHELGWLEEVFQNFRLGKESKARMKDHFGSIRTFQVNFRILPMTAGEYIVSLTDITDLENYYQIIKDSNRVLEVIVNERTEELRRTNIMLENSRQQLEQAQHIASIGSWEWSSTDRVFKCSDELARILGIADKSELTTESLLDLVVDEDKNIVLSFIKGKKKPLDYFDETVQIVRSNGEKRIIHAQGRVTTDENNNIFVLGTAHDITEMKKTEMALRQNEQLLSFIFEFASFGICLVDEDGNIVRFNRKFTNLVGLEDERLKSSNLFDVFKRETKEHKLNTLEWYYTNSKGQLIDLLVTAAEMNIVEESRHYIYSFADITEKNRIEKIHREQEQMLIQQSKLAALGEMIGAIAHQWKQPLNSTSLYVQLIEDDYDFNELTKEKLSNYVVEIMDQINYMAHTIEDFRTFFTPSKSLGEFSITKALNDVINLMKSSIEKHKIKVNIISNISDTESFVLFGYASEFKQVMVNLLSNAKDAIESKRQSMPPIERKNIGNIDIIINESSNEITIEARDDGGGIPEHSIKNIFESYFTTKGEEGTGIGLYMSRMIVENRMKGSITAFNSDTGAVFKMCFPKNLF